VKIAVLTQNYRGGGSNIQKSSKFKRVERGEAEKKRGAGRVGRPLKKKEVGPSSPRKADGKGKGARNFEMFWHGGVSERVPPKWQRGGGGELRGKKPGGVKEAAKKECPTETKHYKAIRTIGRG